MGFCVAPLAESLLNGIFPPTWARRSSIALRGKKNVYEVKTAKNADELVKNIEKQVGKSLSDVGDLLKNPIDKLFNKNKKKNIWDKEAHKLEVFINGKKILQIEGRYVNKHKAYAILGTSDVLYLTMRHILFH